MSKRIALLTLSIALPLLIAGLLFHVSHTAANAFDWRHKLDPLLLDIEDDTEHVRFIVYFQEAASLRQPLPHNIENRRLAIVQSLQTVATASQSPLQNRLQTLESYGVISFVQPLWIVNAIVVEGRPRAAMELAQIPGVSRVDFDPRYQFLQLPELQPQQARLSDWNLAQIGVPEVWNGLGINGEGVTIAIMDTGVDWRHPDLRSNYRGQQASGSVQHQGNWFDVVQGGSPSEPFDPNGHGTHVAGTALGQGGTGVAPGAQWIAVRAFDSGGFATTGDLLLAFQWLLAPEGQPQLAPDIVNGSWTGAGNNPVFETVLDVFHEAGIMTVFAAGNSGPDSGTIGAPASYSRAIAVAAVDYRPDVTWFSSRGPSPLTTRPKPDLSAPGARVYSTLPGGAYGYYNGTSMAAPHVSGVAALLLEANPTLDINSILRTMTETARAITANGHDANQGWGLIDAYRAVASQMTVGRIRGTVLAEGIPLPGATVTITNSSGARVEVQTGGSGHFESTLRPGSYHVEASQFGYTSPPPVQVQLPLNGTVHRTISLLRQPHARITGTVTAGDEPIASAQIRVDGAPITTVTNTDGQYALSLPVGHSYTLRAVKTGYRIAQTQVTLTGSMSQTHHFSMQPSQSILLVDSGRWYYDSYVNYYHAALAQAGYAFDEWPIYSPLAPPSADDLNEYDTVIWTAPQDSPGWIGAGGAVHAFLESGGNLLISGQNVARRDGIRPTSQGWFTNLLQGVYVGLASRPYTIHGDPNSPFSHLQFDLNGEGGARNQETPSEITFAPDSLTHPVLRYDNAGDENIVAGLQAGLCQPYEIVFAAFGLEAVPSTAIRGALIDHSLAVFAAPPRTRGIALTPSQMNEVLLPGETLTVTYKLTNLSEVQTSTIHLQYDSRWPSQLSHHTVRLGPCQQQVVTMTVQAPATLPNGAIQAIELNAFGDNGAVSGASIIAATPKPTLLVADYRWYDMAPAYRDTLHSLGISFDTWDTTTRGSPSRQRLEAYETVLWFTGYDWYEPLTPSEVTDLHHYLEQGGRLFLSSQDYLYYHRHRAFTGKFLGVLDYQESVTSTVLLGGDNAELDDGAGPYPLNFDVYRNFSDSLTPIPGVPIHLWNDWGLAAGVLHQGDGWRTAFWGTPVELLDDEHRRLLLGDIMSWLSDIGDTTFEVSHRTAPAHSTRQYTLTVRNWAFGAPHVLSVTTSLDEQLTVITSSITGGAAYVPEHHQLRWQDVLAPGASHTIVFEAVPSGVPSPGERLDVTTTVSYEGSPTTWQRIAPTWVETPDLSSSQIRHTPGVVRPWSIAIYTATLLNASPLAASNVSATLAIPAVLQPISQSLTSPSGTVSLTGNRVNWQGAIEGNASITFTIAVSSTGFTSNRSLTAGLIIDDNSTAPLIRNDTLRIVPYRWLLPLITTAQE